jgi:hypothetical protein
MKIIVRLLTSVISGLLGITILSSGYLPVIDGILTASSLILLLILLFCLVIGLVGVFRNWHWAFPFALSFLTGLVSAFLFVITAIRLSGAPPSDELSWIEIVVSIGIPAIGCIVLGLVYELFRRSWTQNT